MRASPASSSCGCDSRSERERRRRRRAVRASRRRPPSVCRASRESGSADDRARPVQGGCGRSRIRRRRRTPVRRSPPPRPGAPASRCAPDRSRPGTCAWPGRALVRPRRRPAHGPTTSRHRCPALAPPAVPLQPMAVLIASNLRKELSGDPLFDGVSFKVERRDRVALSGPNGAGKTTLLRALVGETSIQGGELAFEKGTRVALHDQRPPLERRMTLREYVLSGATDLLALEGELRQLEEAMSGGDHADATIRRYGEAQARLEHAGGYDWRERATAVLRGLGFHDEHLDRHLETFSGGELTRASLARALGGDPALLLLDEPTNHLDVASLEWLERELRQLDAAVILVAHDRWFLEAVTTATLEVVAGRGTFFPGPWHAWRREKAARLLHAQKELDRVQVDIARLERFVERFRAKKDKAKQAQAKVTHIGRLEKERANAASEVELLGRRTRTLGFEFLKPPRSGRTVIEADGLDVSIGAS